MRKLCPVSGTGPLRENHEGHSGRFYDGGFYWCECGAIVRWLGRPFEPAVAFVDSHYIRGEPSRLVAVLRRFPDRSRRWLLRIVDDLGQLA